jgi:hypothetical protein
MKTRNKNHNNFQGGKRTAMKLQLCAGVGERLSRQAKSLKGKPPTPV